MKLFALILLSSLLVFPQESPQVESPQIDLRLQLRLANVEKQALQLEVLAQQLRNQMRDICAVEGKTPVQQDDAIGEWKCLSKRKP